MRPLPSHTTRHAGPHRAVREVEVNPVVLDRGRGRRSSSLTGSDLASPRPLRTAPRMRTSDAISNTSSSQESLLLVRPFTGSRQLLRPLLTSHSGSSPSPFQAQSEISPGKNALFHCTTAGFTPPPFGHKSFAVACPLALVGTAFDPVLVHRPAASLHASSPHSVTLMQLRFAPLTVTSL